MKIKINTPLKAKIRNKRPPIFGDLLELLFQHLEELFNALLEGRNKKESVAFSGQQGPYDLTKRKKTYIFFPSTNDA